MGTGSESPWYQGWGSRNVPGVFNCTFKQKNEWQWQHPEQDDKASKHDTVFCWVQVEPSDLQAGSFKHYNSVIWFGNHQHWQALISFIIKPVTWAPHHSGSSIVSWILLLISDSVNRGMYYRSGWYVHASPLYIVLGIYSLYGDCVVFDVIPSDKTQTSCYLAREWSSVECVEDRFFGVFFVSAWISIKSSNFDLCSRRQRIIKYSQRPQMEHSSILKISLNKF